MIAANCIDTSWGNASTGGQLTWGGWLRAGVVLLRAEIMRVGVLLWEAQERCRQRRALLALDGRMLADIGLSRCDAEREAAKSCWRA